MTTLPCGCHDVLPARVEWLTVRELIKVARHPYVHREDLGCCWDGVLARYANERCVRLLESVQVVLA